MKTPEQETAQAGGKFLRRAGRIVLAALALGSGEVVLPSCTSPTESPIVSTESPIVSPAPTDPPVGGEVPGDTPVPTQQETPIVLETPIPTLLPEYRAGMSEVIGPKGMFISVRPVRSVPESGGLDRNFGEVADPLVEIAADGSVVTHNAGDKRTNIIVELPEEGSRVLDDNKFVAEITFETNAGMKETRHLCLLTDRPAFLVYYPYPNEAPKGVAGWYLVYGRVEGDLFIEDGGPDGAVLLEHVAKSEEEARKEASEKFSGMPEVPEEVSAAAAADGKVVYVARDQRGIFTLIEQNASDLTEKAVSGYGYDEGKNEFARFTKDKVEAATSETYKNNDIELTITTDESFAKLTREGSDGAIEGVGLRPESVEYVLQWLTRQITLGKREVFCYEEGVADSPALRTVDDTSKIEIVYAARSSNGGYLAIGSSGVNLIKTRGGGLRIIFLCKDDDIKAGAGRASSSPEIADVWSGIMYKTAFVLRNIETQKSTSLAEYTEWVDNNRDPIIMGACRPNSCEGGVTQYISTPPKP